MRTQAFIVVLAVTFVAACGDSDNTGALAPNFCATSDGVDGAICGSGKICKATVCVVSSCGDKVVAGNEDCDGGAGCNADCTFLCTDDPATQCAATTPACQRFACKADHSCEMIADEEANLEPCDPANADNVCIVGACKAAPVCGNGVQELGEECDDGNSLGLDGCERCAVEQFAHVTSLLQQFGTDAFCTKNALGVAIPNPAARDFIQQTWSFPVASGDLSLVFEFVGTLETSGVRSKFNLGFVDAMPIRFNAQDDGSYGDNYDGTSDLDWWYTLRDPASVDGNRTPRVQLPAEVTNRHLTAGPGTIESLRLLFALAPANVKLFNVHIDATLDDKLSKPMVLTTGTPPGHLASEHLSPAFSTFESSGVTSPLGGMCSDVSARSLSDASLGLLLACADPADPTGSTAAFSEGDPERPDNHLLDAFVFGCQLFSTDPDTGEPGFVATIAPTQPDGSLDGSIYSFAFDPGTHRVTSCTKDGNPAEDLDGCFANATFSSYFKIAADRVIVRADLPSVLPAP